MYCFSKRSLFSVVLGGTYQNFALCALVPGIRSSGGHSADYSAGHECDRMSNHSRPIPHLLVGIGK